MNDIEKNNFKILIVDDNPDNVQVLGSMLRENNYSVAFATDGEKALKTLANNKDFDLILMDVDMPVMDGYETCVQIRKDSALDDVPIVFLTAFAERENLIKGLELGAQDYVVKPFYSQELLLRINTHLQLKHRTQKLKSLNLLLEQKVNERTADLVEANKKLSKLDNAKNYTLGLLSHELNTPLIGINGNAKFIREISDDPVVKECCDDILESEKRLRNFTDIALLITSIKAERQHIHYNSEKLDEFIDSAINKYQSTSNKNKIRIKKSTSNKDIMIKADYSLIAKVFDFIVENAVKYSPDNSEVEILDHSSDNEYEIIIKDQGKGFEKKQLENKFELFQTEDLLKHTEGTGLSLVAAKAIMELHDFQISLQNAIGGGAQVNLKFPIGEKK